jgi:hypothetical protein
VSCIRIKNEYINGYLSKEKGKDYFITDYSGISLIIDKNKNEITYLSVFGLKGISFELFSKYLKTIRKYLFK